MLKFLKRSKLTEYSRQWKCEFGTPGLAATTLVGNSAKAAKKSSVAYLFAGYGNTGDHASYEGIRRLIDIPGPTYFPSQFYKHATFLEKKKKLLLIGGGGLLQPVFEPFWNKLVESKVRFGLIGIGLAEAPPYRPKFDPQLLQQIMGRASFSFVRDNYTAEHCSVAGGSPKVIFCPAAACVLNLPVSTSTERHILLNAIHPSDLRFADIHQKHLRSTLKTIASQRGLRYEEVDHNVPFSDKISRLYRHAAFSVSSRLHGCIFSYLLGVPCLPICCDIKTKAFYDTHTNYNAPTSTDAVRTLKHGLKVACSDPADRERKIEIINHLKNSASAVKLEIEGNTG